MVKIIAGTKGSGKTKLLIDKVNEVVKEDKGTVICIESGNSLTYDVSHDVRLVDFSEYGINPGVDTLYAFICGLYAQNYDITNIFIDGLYRFTHTNDVDEIVGLLDKFDIFSEKNSVNVTALFSADLDDEQKAKLEKYL